MPVHCPQCGKIYDVIKFEGGRCFKCQCGFMLELSFMETVDDFLRYFENEDQRRKALEVQQDSQQICRMILDENCPKVDIEIAKERLEEKAKSLFPDKMEIYRMIYEARFKRLWEQFRESK